MLQGCQKKKGNGYASGEHECAQGNLMTADLSYRDILYSISPDVGRRAKLMGCEGFILWEAQVCSVNFMAVL